jgi:outer membrane protein assembly factor BamE (lipoprotein component of BamABCDE complex)
MYIFRVGTLLIMLVAVGCETTGTTAANDDSAIAKIKVGASRKPDVRRILGEPSVAYRNLLVQGKTNDVWSYRYSHRQKDPLTLVPILNFYSAQGTLEESSVNVFFDPVGTVTDVQIARHKMSSHMR